MRKPEDHVQTQTAERRLFRRKVDLSPADYRKRFGSTRRALQSVGT